MEKLLFVDIDGTIAHDTGEISGTTKRTLKKFKNIILTTGRARSEVKKICDELGFRYFISSYLVSNTDFPVDAFITPYNLSFWNIIIFSNIAFLSENSFDNCSVLLVDVEYSPIFNFDA